MAVTVSLAVLLGILTVVFYRVGLLRLWPSLTVCAFGFTLASTGAGPAITQLLNSLVTAISHAAS
ncbi:hypothetical protein [Kitasatospora sp. MBT66]|uniref:hypothetical protein n=1 Tax=Kitasatospora sp. MBT66 TaxID=1444769 RepID=UPI00068CB7C0|nr:hypothetical protein [Kitasatospora sp. MBT66]